MIAGVAVAPGEVKCGVYRGPARSGLSISLMQPRRQRFEVRLAHYLDPDAVIPSCPVRGKPDPIDLSDMEI